MANGESRAAARVAIHLGEDDAGDAKAFVELVGRFDGVLARHGVGDEEDLDGVKLLFELLQLSHQIVVDVEAAGGVDQQNVAAGLRAFAARGAGQVERLRFSGRAFIDWQTDVARDHLQLLARGRPVDIHRYHHGAMAVLREPARELAGGGGLTRALQADDHEDAGRLVGEAQARFVAAQNLDQLFLNDLDHLLRRRKGAEHFLAHGLDLDVLDELLDYFEIDVGFEQRHADFAQGAFHILGRELAFAAKVLEDALELFR